MTALPNNDKDLKDALGTVTISTPLLTPVRPDASRRLDLSKQYSVEAIKKELNKANMGLSNASLRSLSTALAVSLAGPSIAQSATTGQSLAPDGTVTTTDESTRTVSQQTPDVPDAPSAGQPNEKALEALIGLLSRSETDYQLPVGETMSLVASLHTYGVALEEFYNYQYFNDVLETNRLYVLRQQREKDILEERQLAIRNERDNEWKFLASLRRANSGFESFISITEGNANAARNEMNRVQADLMNQTVARLDELAEEKRQVETQIDTIKDTLAEKGTIMVPYRMTFRVVAAPGWYSQQNQLDVVADIELPKTDSGIEFRFAGAVPAETTQTLDEFAATLRQLSNALELGGAYGPVAAKATVQRIAAKAERLEGIRSNTTFIAEFPDDGDTLRLRFSPSVVANASRRMLDRTGINVTALVLVKVPVIDGVPPLELPEQAKLEIRHRFEPTLRLVGGGKYKGPKRRALRSRLDEAREKVEAGEAEADKQQPVTRTVSLPPFALDDRIGKLAFAAGGTQSLTWIERSRDESYAGKALVTTRLVSLDPKDEIKLTLMGSAGTLSIQRSTAVANEDEASTWKVQPGDDVVFQFDVPVDSLKPAKDPDKLPTITPFPVVLHATDGKRSIAQTVMVGGASGRSGGPGGSESSTPPKKDEKPVLTYDRAGVKIEIPVDQLTPELAEVLKATFKDLTIVVPELIAHPPKDKDKGDQDGAGAASGSSGDGG